MTATKTIHRHWCELATGRNRRQDAPDAECVRRGSPIRCSTHVCTVSKTRRQKNRPGEVKVEWVNEHGDFEMVTWETDSR